MAPFYGWGSTASSLVPLWGSSLLFTTKFPDIPGTHFIDLGRMKGWVDLVVSFSENFMEHVTGHWSNVGWETFPGITPFLERQKRELVEVKVQLKLTIILINTEQSPSVPFHSILATNTKQKALWWADFLQAAMGKIELELFLR